MISQKDKQFNVLPPHMGLRKYIQYYNVVFPEKDTFLPQYTLMPNACGTLSLVFDGFSIRAELWGATTMPIPLGAEPNGYRMLLLIQFSPYGLYQITGQSQTEFADKRLSLAEIDVELYGTLHQAVLSSKTILHQNTVMDIGEHVAFEGFSLQQGYAEIVGIASDSVKEQSHNFQMYFEVENLDQVYAELKRIPSLQWVHEIREYPWGQRNIRIYDPDKYIVEIAEDMTTVFGRFFAQGMSAEEIAKRTMYPLEVVKTYSA